MESRILHGYAGVLLFVSTLFLAYCPALPAEAPLAEAEILDRQAVALQQQGHYADAEPLYERALAIREGALGPEHRAVAVSLDNLAALYQKEGRYADAEPLYKRALAILEKALGPDHPDTGTCLNNLAGLYRAEGRYADAEPLYERSLAIAEKNLGPDDPIIAVRLNNLAGLYKDQGRYAEAEVKYKLALAALERIRGANDVTVATASNNLAGLYVAQGRYVDAEPLYQRALEINEQALGPDHVDVARNLSNLATLYWLEGRYADAEPIGKRALAIREKALGPDHPDVAASLTNLGMVYENQGRYAEAEPLYERALAIREKVLGPDNPDVAESLNNLAVLHQDQGRYGEVEALLQRANAITEKALGPGHPGLAIGLNNLAAFYIAEGRYTEAGPLFKRVLAIDENALGPDHPDLANSLNNLASLYQDEGRFAEAEALFKRALTIREKALGPDNPDVAGSLNNLATVAKAEGRYADAEPLLKRARAILEKALGPDHLAVATALDNLGALYEAQSLYEEAEPLYKRSLAIREKALGPDHPDIAASLSNLGVLYQQQGRIDEAEPLYKRALEIREKTLGPNHPDVANSLSNLGALYATAGRYADAEPLYHRALAINETTLGRDNPNTAITLNLLSQLYRGQERYSDALAASGQVVEIFAQHLSIGAAQRFGVADAERRADRGFFANYIAIASAVTQREPSRRASLAAETFRVAQLANASSVARAVAGMSVRFGTGNDALAQAIRERQDLVGQWQALDAALTKAASLPPGKRRPTDEAELRGRLDDAAQRIRALDQRIADQFPDFAKLSNPQPLTVDAAQALLDPDEALLVYLTAEEGTWLWVVRRDTARIYQLDASPTSLTDKVTTLRATLDPERNPQLKPFPVADAYELYEKILAPAANQLSGVRRLIVVPDGALESLPLAVLATRPPADVAESSPNYRAVSWLVRDYAISVLPSVSSLAALRGLPRPAANAGSFLGVGDPVLEGDKGQSRGADQLLFQGSIADVDAVRKLPSLPETAVELRSIAAALGAPESDLLLGERASEPVLRQMPLAQYRIIDFATHGLISGDLPGLAEPALVLTPPAEASAANDGLLTASKIATLKLNADWVVLSACNTAAPDGTPDAEGLSGLAKAFFYAGARSVLVSHWEVPSMATVTLMTTAFAQLTRDPSIGRAEAMRRSELAMLDPASPPEFANPMVWAPFVLAGEGAPGR